MNIKAILSASVLITAVGCHQDAPPPRTINQDEANRILAAMDKAQTRRAELIMEIGILKQQLADLVKQKQKLEAEAYDSGPPRYDRLVIYTTNRVIELKIAAPEMP